MKAKVLAKMFLLNCPGGEGSEMDAAASEQYCAVQLLVAIFRYCNASADYL